MVAANIKVFMRIRPSAKPSKAFISTPDEGKMAFEFDKDIPNGQVNNTKTNYRYRFDGILPMAVTQEQVFDMVAKPVIDDVLQGINGTIFAYGQTGSGKTFTITGGAEKYADRGLIPRTIAYLFETFRRGDANYKLYISYLEIYNDSGYDLLSRGDDSTTKLEDLPKVQLREDEEGNIHLRNLSVNMAQKEEDALNLLFLGDTNRVVAETPMNDASTRSHCMFILWVDATRHDSDTVRRAKLHLVDLAGSERISKTGVEGKLQKEATCINLSLHYLEQVIVSLQERTTGHRTHVPYRNSMMTSVLRDSLGGNCRTVMVGAAAVEEHNIDETISTCRFAQRVAMIKNNASVNEELDPSLLIKRLKKDVAELKDELRLLNNSDDEDPLTAEDLEECKQLVSSFLTVSDPQANFVCGSTLKFRECFRILREVYWQRQAEGGGGDEGAARGAAGAGAGGSGPSPMGGGIAVGSLEAGVLELRQQVIQRDQEIKMLVGSLGKRSKGRDARAVASDGRVFIAGSKNGRPPKPGDDAEMSMSAGAAAASPQISRSPDPSSDFQPAAEVERAPPNEVDSNALFLDRNKAFEAFRKSVRRGENMEDNREAMKKLATEARAVGERANAARAAINAAKTKIEKIRMERAMASSPRDPDAEGAHALPDGPEVKALLAEVDEHKLVYQQSTQRLSQVKAQIEQYQHLGEQSKQRLQNDFEAWLRSSQAHQAAAGGAMPGVSSGASPGPVAVARGRASSVPAPMASPAASQPAVPAAPVSQSSASSRSKLSEADLSSRPTPDARPRPAARPASSEHRQAERPIPGAWSAASLVASPASSPSGTSLPPRESRKPLPERTSTASTSASVISPARPFGGSGAGGGLVPALAKPSPARVDAQRLSTPGRVATPPARVATPPSRVAKPARVSAAAAGTVAAPSAAVASASSTPAAAKTGDAGIDDDIAAYFAAIAELQK